jgi:hypothetical protein
MRGYKIATHVTQHGNDIDYSYYTVLRKVLVVLDIPDDVKRTTPEMRYSKVPLGLLTTNQLNEWYADQYKYKMYFDAHALFCKFKDCIDKWATGVYVGDSRFYNDCVHVRKCRAAIATVVKIIDLTDGTSYDCAHSDFDEFTIYRTGETVIPDMYTDDYLNICAHGIHYFESPDIAMLYHAKDLPPSDASVFLNHAEELLKKLRKEGDI